MSTQYTYISKKNQQKKEDESSFKLEGNLLGNAADNLNRISAGITTFVGGVAGAIDQVVPGLPVVSNMADKEATQVLTKELETWSRNPAKALEDYSNAVLSSYNMTIDDIGTLPIGEVVGRVASGAWKNPIDAALDFIPAYSAVNRKVRQVRGLDKAAKEKLNKLDEYTVRADLAGEVVQDNVRVTSKGNQFVKQVEAIEKKYDAKTISQAMEAIETVGFKRARKDLLPAMNDLSNANNTYKELVAMAGGELLDDIDFAARELLAKRSNIPFGALDDSILKSDMYKDTYKFVQENDIRPLFHLKPKVLKNLSGIEEIESEFLKRKFGTIDYKDAPKDFSKKAYELVDKIIGTKAAKSVESLNSKIEAYNKSTGKSLSKLNSLGNRVFQNQALHELNSELKKVMLSAGTYLGANVISTTLSILNNFNLDAATKTLKSMPKFQLVELTEATTPGLKTLSRVNNFFYRPAASIDRYLENIASTYIANHPVKDTYKYMLSAIPSKVPTTNVLEGAVKSLVPFGSYPSAAIKEVANYATGRPGRTLLYNQLNKVGQQWNVAAQEEVEGLKNIDPTKAIRAGMDGKLIQRSTVVTPIQAANMFLLGTQGDAIQIPLFTFFNKLISGKGNPNVIEIGGKSYRVEQGKVQTAKGEFDLIPSLTYIGRNLLSPVQFYNQVLVPLSSDKYIKDETRLGNILINESQYANMNKRLQSRVTTKAREKLGKRVLGTYEYTYYEPRVGKNVSRNVQRKLNERKQLNRILNNK